jgi:hypothetical protein
MPAKRIAPLAKVYFWILAATATSNLEMHDEESAGT